MLLIEILTVAMWLGIASLGYGLWLVLVRARRARRVATHKRARSQAARRAQYRQTQQARHLGAARAKGARHVAAARSPAQSSRGGEELDLWDEEDNDHP